MPRPKETEVRVNGVAIKSPETQAPILPTPVAQLPAVQLEAIARGIDPVWEGGEIVDQTKWASLREAAALLDLSEQWVRRQVIEGRLTAEKDVTGKWWVMREDVSQGRTALEKKYEKREQRRAGLLKAEYLPPSLKSVKMIRTKVLFDGELSDGERAAFLSALERYEEQYQTDLAFRRG